MTRAVPKSALFERLGYGPPFDRLEEALEQAGLSRRDKVAIDPRKETEVAALLGKRFVAVCSRGDCHSVASNDPRGREVVHARSQGDCSVCGGSPTAVAVDRMIDAWQRAGLSRLCVVGGSPNAHRELEAAVAGRLELRLVDGTVSRSASDARSDLAWADRVAIWGGTQLSHKVSRLYKGPNVVQFAKRSIGELAAEMTASAHA